MSEPPARLSARQAADYCGVAQTTVRRWLTSGRLRATLLEGAYQIDPADLEPFRARRGAHAGVHSGKPPDAPGAPEVHHGVSLPVPDGAPSGDPALVALVEKLHREVTELAGRCGFYQAENLQLKQQLQRAETRILELEAPKEPVPAAASGASTVVATGDVPVEYQDRDLTCVDCGQVFRLTAGERAFYTKRGLVEPKRCSTCRTARRQQKKQVRAKHIHPSILTDHAPAEMSNHPTPEQNGQDSGSQAVSEEPTKQPQAEAGSGVGALPATSSQETSSGGAFKRFWRWLIRPV